MKPVAWPDSVAEFLEAACLPSCRRLAPRLSAAGSVPAREKLHPPELVRSPLRARQSGALGLAKHLHQSGDVFPAVALGDGPLEQLGDEVRHRTVDAGVPGLRPDALE